MIAIEAHPRVVCEPGARLERGLWYQALTLLSAERDKLALNGIVVCISAQTLLAGPDAAKATGIRLRRLVDEAMAHLQIRSEEHTSELQSIMRTSYAVFCL